MRPTLPKTYHHYLRRLTPLYGANEGRALLQRALAAVGMTWSDALCADFAAVEGVDIDRLEAIIARMERYEPIQYILGEAVFCGRHFAVDRRVLIPRPETEDLVQVIDSAYATAESAHRPITALDIGTGSGCIALTLAIEHPSWQVTAWDNSADALAIARQNAARHSVATIRFEQIDILLPNLPPGPWDIIVSNPPYVCAAERQTMAPNVLDYEPAEALFVPDAQPLLFYEAITRYAMTALRPGGRLFFEVNTRYAAAVAALLTAADCTAVTIARDRFARERIVYATHK